MRLMLTTAVLSLVALTLAPPVHAAPKSSGIIRDADMEPFLRELQERVKLVREGKTKAQVLLDYFKSRAEASVNPREKAMRHFVYGYTLQMVFKRPTEAQKAFKRALASYAAFPAAHTSLAALAESKRNLRRAHEHLDRAIAIDSNYLPAIINKARIYDRQGKHDKAIRWFKRSMGIEVTGEACIGLARIYVVKYHAEIDEKAKEKWGKKAIGASRAYVFQFPKSPRAHLFQAKVFKDLRMIDKSVAKLESIHNDTTMEQGARDDSLKMLAQLYSQLYDLKNLERVLERLVNQESLKAEERGVLKERLADLREMGKAAPAVWQVKSMLDVVKNNGIPTDARVKAMRTLLQLYVNDALLGNKHLKNLAPSIIRHIMRSLIKSPPELTIEVLRFLRTDVKDPQLVRILVHFVYPFEDSQRTVDVRKEAVRAVAACGAVIALPTLFYCLEDTNGAVMRDLDLSLARICARRSAVRGDGVADYTDEQVQKARKTWIAYARSEDASPLFEQAFAGLTKVVGADPSQARTQRSAPLVDHTVSLVLLDDDMPWRTWSAGYEFLRVYWGRDFRAPERREKPVVVGERAAIVKELRDFWSRPDSKDASAQAPNTPSKEDN